jgi:hypothetical protein
LVHSGVQGIVSLRAATYLGAYLAGQGDNTVLNIVFNGAVEFVPNQNGVEILFNTVKAPANPRAEKQKMR